MSVIAEAASVLLSRGPGSPELFVVRRSEQLRFFGGFHAFPGGRVGPEDEEALPFFATGPLSLSQPERICRLAAVRELFEETGVLLARRDDGAFPAAGPAQAELRHELLEGRLSFARLLEREHLTVQGNDLQFAGRLVTPAFAPQRFDTAFFLADAPAGQHAEVWDGELAEGRWCAPRHLLDQWTRGDCLVSPPTVQILEALAERPVAEDPRHLAAVFESRNGAAIPPILFAPAVQLIPLRTLALPPSTHTNAFLVGTGPCYLLDPGPNEPEEQQRLFEALDRHQAGGPRLTAIVLTHHHPDHVGAANACAERYRVPIWAYPWTANKLRGKINVTREIHDGERLHLGPAPDGSGPWHLEAIHTPGHAPGHLAFYEPHYRLLFAADLVSTVTSIIIAPPEGDLAVYLDSLRRVRGYDSRLLLPSHGGPTVRVNELLDEAVAHRQKREEQLVAALRERPRTIEELMAELYKGLPAPLQRFAELQLLAGLEKLQREGRAKLSNEGTPRAWRLRTGF